MKSVLSSMWNNRMIGLLNAHSLSGFQSDAITFRVILNCTFGGEKRVWVWFARFVWAHFSQNMTFLILIKANTFLLIIIINGSKRAADSTLRLSRFPVRFPTQYFRFPISVYKCHTNRSIIIIFFSSHFFPDWKCFHSIL